MAGPLTDDLIHRIGRWNMRDTFRDFDRRATALNEAMEAVARALDRNQKSLRYRLGNRPIDLPSNFPDRPPFAIPPCPDGDTIPPAYPPSLKAALRYAWTIATRLAFADFEFRELHRRYQARPIHPAVTLTFPDPDLVSPGGGPAWLVLPTGAIAFRLSHAILQSHGLPRPQRPILLAVEAIRRTISQSRERAAALARRLHSRAEAAVLAFDRGMVSAQVMLHRNPAASGGPRKGAADAS